MSRRFWGGVMFLTILLMAGSGYLIFDRLSVPEPQPVPLREVPPSEAPPIPADAAGTANNTVPAAPLPSTATVTTEKEPVKAPAIADKDAKRNILFKLVRPNAKDVQILGDFNNWMRQSMKKKGKNWEISVPLKPGTYEYAFVVDGKRVRDPNNKQAGANGKSSVLTVKPLAARP